jgi:hypothetical protein
VKEWMATITGLSRLAISPAKRAVIGSVEQVQPPFDLGGIGVAVGGDDRAVVDLHQQGRIILAPVGVDHQPREP